jgi:hypothetical protein
MPDTLDYIVNKFQIDLTQPSPIYLPIGRLKDMPRLFNELNFKLGAEIGVYRADYAWRLLHYNPGLKLYGIDPWTPYPGYKDFRATDILEAETIALAKVQEFDCTLIKGYSTDIVTQFDDESLDFVNIDSNHSYENVVADIAAWSRKVRKDGIIMGHDFDDYTNHWRWREMGVINAVTGWMASYKISPWFVLTRNRNRSWFYVK